MAKKRALETCLEISLKPPLSQAQCFSPHCCSKTLVKQDRRRDLSAEHVGYGVCVASMPGALPYACSADVVMAVHVEIRE